MRGMFLFGMRMSFALCTFLRMWMFSADVDGEEDVLFGDLLQHADDLCLPVDDVGDVLVVD